MREFRHETLIITKEAWKFLKNHSRTSKGYSELEEEKLEKIWQRIDKEGFRNDGAPSKKYPITMNEMRINPDTFAFKWGTLKQILQDKGYGYREDGYIIDGCYL